MLTKGEALLAARVAEKYPPGHGRHYGYSKVLQTDTMGDRLAERIRAHPAAGRYG